MYQSLGKLTEQSWNEWNLSQELKDILSLSKTLRDFRKEWKTTAHRNKNRNRVPSGSCSICKDFEDSKKCIQYLQVSKTGLYTLEKKLIIPEEDPALVRYCLHPIFCTELISTSPGRFRGKMSAFERSQFRIHQF